MSNRRFLPVTSHSEDYQSWLEYQRGSSGSFRTRSSTVSTGFHPVHDRTIAPLSARDHIWTVEANSACSDVLRHGPAFRTFGCRKNSAAVISASVTCTMRPRSSHFVFPTPPVPAEARERGDDEPHRNVERFDCTPPNNFKTPSILGVVLLDSCLGLLTLKERRCVERQTQLTSCYGSLRTLRPIENENVHITQHPRK